MYPRSIRRGPRRREIQYSTFLDILYRLSRSGVFWIYSFGDIHVAVTRQTRTGRFDKKTLCYQDMIPIINPNIFLKIKPGLYVYICIYIYVCVCELQEQQPNSINLRQIS